MLSWPRAEWTIPTQTKLTKHKPAGDRQLVPAPLAKFSRKAQEAGEARRWGIRLLAIVDRCGNYAAIAGDPKDGSPLSKDEMNALRAIVYESGGFRTIRQCVRHWERARDTGPLGVYQGHTANHAGPHQVTLRPGMRAGGNPLGQWCSEVDLQEDRDGGSRSPAHSHQGPAEEGLLEIVAPLERYLVNQWKAGSD